MALQLKLNQKLDLQLKLAPQIIQSIEILQLPTVDLQKLIEQELDTNDYLEVGKKDDEVSPEASPSETGDATREVELETLEAQGYWDEEMPRFKSALNHEASDRKLEAMNNTAGKGPSLHDYLLEQFALIDIDERYRPFGERLITHVNGVGRLDADFEKLVEEETDLDRDECEFVLGEIQRKLEPRGIAARSSEECLLLQLDPKDVGYDLKVRLITEHIEDLKKNRRPKIARSLGISLEQLEEIVVQLSELDYQPGKSAVDDSPQYIYPDIIVDWMPDDTGAGMRFEVRLAGSNYPALNVSSDYRTVLDDKRVPTEYRDQVRKQVDNAKWLISAIEQRQDTLLRVARRIVHYQRDFLEFGPHHLKPLKMQQIADDLGIHVSTVSRATHEKYMQTHRGIFSLKSFFSGATASVDGGVESRASVKQRVKEIIDQEDKHNPLSDEEIVGRLRKYFGVDVARRTITKYRKALGIPSTRQRRVYT